jgi:hypothetical protein
MPPHLLVAALAWASALLFSQTEPIKLAVTAPFNALFEHARTNEDYSVSGSLTIDRHRIDDLAIRVRGNTSRRQDECPFPKLKIEFPAGSSSSVELFAGLKSLRIGTHCGEAADDHLTHRYGRLPNQHSPQREVFVYSLLAAMQVPALKARSAAVTYTFTDPKPGAPREVTRQALLLEDADAAVKRVGGHRDITESEFTTARDLFEPADTLRLALAEAMIGNFDWCLKMTPGDTYRCDRRHPAWNIAVADLGGGKALPLLYDFDVSGMVTGRHPWFTDVFNADFVTSQSVIETEVVAQVQRTRTLFARPELDAGRREFTSRKQVAFQTLDAARLDPEGARIAREYLEAFFAAIESDQAFYRPVVTTTGAEAYANSSRQPLCAAASIPQGTPVSEPLSTDGSLVQVRLLDALWRWAPPVKCDGIQGPVWIDAAAIGREFPRR